MDSVKYIGMDVHKEAISVAVLNTWGKLVMECTIETKASTILDFLQGLRGSLHVTLEEGTWAAWLYDLIKPQVAELVVCNPRRNALLKEGSKSDRIDARKLAELLRSNMVRSVYHGEHGVRTLRELARSYLTISTDLIRVMTRVKTIYRSWGIACRGKQVYAERHRAEWLGKIQEAGVRRRAEFYYQQLDALRVLRQEVRRELLAEAQKHEAWKLLREIPFIGPIRAALLIALMQTPHRFRTKRQLWSYSGFGIETHSSAEQRFVQGELQRAKKPASIRGLNRNHKLKNVFKSAATVAAAKAGPFKEFYDALVAKGIRPEMARLTLARKMAAITLLVWKKGVRFDAQHLKLTGDRTMSRISVNFIILLVTCMGSATQSSAQSCEATQSTRELLGKLNEPQDLRQRAADRKAHELAEVRKGLESAPDNIFLHEAYQDLQIGRIGDQREAVAEEYEKLLTKHPKSPAYLYLAARAEYGLESERAIEDLNHALKLAPTFGLPHVLLAQIYFAPAFSDPVEVARHLDRFSELCPSSVRVFPELHWSKDRELVGQSAARVRNGLNGRTDAEAEAAYPILWSLEASLERSDNQVGNLIRISDDAALLQGKSFARNTAWLSALETAADRLDRPMLAREARSEVAVLFPNSPASLWVALAAEDGENPYPTDDPTAERIQVYWARQREMELPLARKWSGVLSVASSALRATANDKSATPQMMSEAVDLFERALNQDPEGSLTFPPAAIDAADELTERRVRLKDVPALVQAGLVLSDRVYANAARSDLYAGQAELAAERRDSWYLDGYLPLAESFIRLGQLTNAADTILQIEYKLDDKRPGAGTSSGAKFQYAEFEARFAYVKGLYDEAEGRKLDALINYRNSIATFPVRRPTPDRRDEVMEDAQRVWKQLGGTADGWNDWAAQSSLRNFYAGSGEGDAWIQLARVRPGFVFTDSLGDKWKPEELSKKVTFVSLWASWCGPCRAELPYVEKLYQHFKGRDDVVVLALDIDDDPKAMDAALKELKLAVPSVAAQDFAYQLVPAMALPANWIITPTKTEKFETDGALEGWLEKAIRACEQSAHVSLSPG